MTYICKKKDKDMRTYIVNDCWNDRTIVCFTNKKIDIATQIAVNKRLNKSDKFGVAWSGRGYWTIETNEEIKKRLEKEYFKPIIFD